MKFRGIAFLACLTVFGLFVGYQALATDRTHSQDLPNPPKPQIVWNGKTAATVATSSCWSYEDHDTCMDTAAPPEVISQMKPAPLQVEPGAALTISFSKSPKKDTLKVTRWNGAQRSEQVLENGNQWLAPDVPGWYLYDVRAEWNQGDAGYAFVIEVRGSEASRALFPDTA